MFNYIFALLCNSRHDFFLLAYGNGEVKNLVCLQGTIPITYKG